MITMNIFNHLETMMYRYFGENAPGKPDGGAQNHSVPVLRLDGISPMAMAIPPNPPVAMYGQYVATGRKNYSEFHQWPSVDHWWKTPGHRWKLTIFEVITFRYRKNMQFSWKFCYNVFRKSNYAIKSVKLHHFWRYGCRIRFKRRSRLNRRKYFGIKGFPKSRFREISYEHHIAIFKKSVWENEFNPKFPESAKESFWLSLCLRLDLCH